MMTRTAFRFVAVASAAALGGCAHRTNICTDTSSGPTVHATPVSAGASQGSSGGSAAGGGAELDLGAGSGSAAGPTASTGAAGGMDAQRAIAEADIVELGSKYLYAMSKSGTLAVVDVSNPAHLVLAGSAMLPGTPFEMYERGTILVAMCNDVTSPTGADAGPVASGAASIGASDDAGATVNTSATASTAFTDPNSAVVIALDVSNPAHVAPLATFQVPGQIADSRIIGDILYLATYENGTCYGCTGNAQTLVTTFDVSDPTQMQRVDQATFLSNAPAAYDLAWGMAWQRSIVATTQRLYLGGQAYVDPSNPQNLDEGIIDVLDVSDPGGHLGKGAHLTIPGAILSRWQMDETGGVLRVVSQHGAGFSGNGSALPEVTTFTIESTQAFAPLGHVTLQLPRQEGLRTVRFDGTRAYAITFNQTDPLFTIDLSNPAAPAQRGNIQMPGWMFYLQPAGDRVIGLGVDRTDPAGNLNVSLFDVSDLTAPQLLTRVPFGSLGVGEDYQILNYELPEDQDNIQKAFQVFSDGVVAIPFSSTGSLGMCGDAASGVQLMQWAGDTISKHGVLPIPGNPKRALEVAGDLLAVSDSNVRSFSLASLDSTTPIGDVTIGTCVAPTLPNSGGAAGGGIVGDGVGD
ncbi:MAG TPA: beta-propeller domain-containing protein, partial [Polyangiaceae bacterium]|nr:beta-propeller domain-containing protein [Polyangiaceae bacterium]